MFIPILTRAKDIINTFGSWADVTDVAPSQIKTPHQKTANL